MSTAPFRLKHLGYFGIEANETNMPKLCDDPCIPCLNWEKVKKINDGTPLKINFNVEVKDWMSEHYSPLHHNTELMEEGLEKLKDEDPLGKAAIEDQIEVITRANSASMLILPFFENNNPRNNNPGSYFTWTNKTLRLIGSSGTVNGNTMPPVGRIRKKTEGVTKWDKRGHLPAAVITDCLGNGPLYFGKDLVYTLNRLQLNEIGVTISKEVDVQLKKNLKNSNTVGEKPIIAELKTSENEKPYDTIKWLNTIIKGVALGGIDHLVNLLIPDDATNNIYPITKVGIANIKEEDDVKLGVEQTYYVLKKILEAVLSELKKYKNGAMGHMRTGWNTSKNEFNIYLKIFNAASKTYNDKEIVLTVDTKQRDLVKTNLKDFKPGFTYIKSDSF